MDKIYRIREKCLVLPLNVSYGLKKRKKRKVLILQNTVIKDSIS